MQQPTKLLADVTAIRDAGVVLGPFVEKCRLMEQIAAQQKQLAALGA